MDRSAEPVVAGAVAAPLLVDLGKDDPGAVAGPDRLADADLGDRLDVFAGGEVADPQLEALRAIVVDQRGKQASVGADLERAEPEIFLALGFGRLVEDELDRRRRRRACGTRCDTCAPGLNAHQ